MSKVPLGLKVVYAIAGLWLFGFGLASVMSQEMSASGSRWRGAGWSMEGAPAVIAGVVIAASGAYLFYHAIKH